MKFKFQSQLLFILSILTIFLFPSCFLESLFNSDPNNQVVNIKSPARATWTKSKNGTVQGETTDAFGNITSVIVNGQSAQTDGTTFTHSLTYSPGINTVESIVKSSKDTFTDRRSVLKGDNFLPGGQKANKGIVMRLGKKVFDSITGMVEKEINAIDLLSLIPIKPININQNGLSLSVTLKEIKKDPISIILTPANSGFISTGVDMRNFVISLQIQVGAGGLILRETVSMKINETKVNANITPSLSNNVISTQVSGINFNISGIELHLDQSGTIGQLLAEANIDINALVSQLNSEILKFVEDAVTKVLKEELPKILNTSFNSLAFEKTINLGSGSCKFAVKSSKIDVNSGGIIMEFSTQVDPNSWKVSSSGDLGSLIVDSGNPNFSSGYNDLSLYLSADFINQVLYGFWGSGLLQINMQKAPGVPYIEGHTPEDTRELGVKIEGKLPPVVVRGTGDNLMDIHVGELELKIMNGNSVLFVIYTGFKAELKLEVSTDGKLTAGIGEIDSNSIWFDLASPHLPFHLEAIFETFISGILKNQIVNLLSSAVSTIPLPQMNGIDTTFHNPTEDNGYLNIGVDVNIKP